MSLSRDRARSARKIQSEGVQEREPVLDRSCGGPGPWDPGRRPPRPPPARDGTPLTLEERIWYILLDRRLAVDSPKPPPYPLRRGPSEGSTFPCFTPSNCRSVAMTQGPGTTGLCLAARGTMPCTPPLVTMVQGLLAEGTTRLGCSPHHSTQAVDNGGNGKKKKTKPDAPLNISGIHKARSCVPNATNFLSHDASCLLR